MNKLGFFLCICLLFFADSSFAARTTVCTGNQYIAKCGPYTIGTNWLKGINADTPNLYDDTDENKNLANLIKFFAGKSFTYTSNGQLKSVSNQDVIDARDTIINALCSPDSVVCEKCPDNGKNENSVYNTSTSTWTSFHTFADCYMDSFRDSKGTFVYVDEDTGTDTLKCHYNVPIQGSYMYGLIQEAGQQEEEQGGGSSPADD